MLEVVTADAEGLAGSVASTKDLSERVSSKVRELDAAQVRGGAQSPRCAKASSRHAHRSTSLSFESASVNQHPYPDRTPDPNPACAGRTCWLWYCTWQAVLFAG